MQNPGDYSLADLAITTALNAVAQTPIRNLEGMKSVTVEARFAYGSGGTTCKVWIQTTHDGGTTWDDVASFAFTTASSLKKINLSALTPITSQVTPTDGSMADNTAQDGMLGSAMHAKITTTGTYSNTVLSVKITVR
jgi:hypothetical protein